MWARPSYTLTCDVVDFRPERCARQCLNGSHFCQQKPDDGDVDLGCGYQCTLCDGQSGLQKILPCCQPGGDGAGKRFEIQQCNEPCCHIECNKYKSKNKSLGRHNKNFIKLNFFVLSRCLVYNMYLRKVCCLKLKIRVTGTDILNVFTQ